MSEFTNEILASVPSGAEFAPYVHYDPDGDTLQFVVHPDIYRAVRIDSALTVYVSDEPGADRVVGGLIKDFREMCKRLCESLPGLSSSAVENGKVRIDALLSAHLFVTAPPEDAERQKYRKQAYDTAQELDEAVAIPC